MSRALVLYHSVFGNTKAVAVNLANGIREPGIATDCVSLEVVEIKHIPDYDFLAIGGPTHMLGMSKTMKAFLQTLKTIDLQGVTGFSFDTRNPSRLNNKRWFMLENSSARRIEGAMKEMKIKIVKPRQSALVEGREGPLDEGTEGLFRRIGVEIAALIE
jgi:flavorubredoxin